MNVRRFFFALALFAGAFAVAHAEDAKNPLADAKEGEWVIQKSNNNYGGMSMSQVMYMFVSKVDGKKVTIMTQMLKEDAKTGMMAANPVTIDLEPKGEAKADPKAPKPEISEDSCEVKGKKIKCTKAVMVTEVAGMGKMTTTSWSSNEVPVYGTVKTETKDKDGKVTSTTETVDFGSSGGAEKPVG